MAGHEKALTKVVVHESRTSARKKQRTDILRLRAGKLNQSRRPFIMPEPTNRVLEEENANLIESFVQDQVEGLLKSTRSQAETDFQQAAEQEQSENQTENPDVNAA